MYRHVARNLLCIFVFICATPALGRDEKACDTVDAIVGLMPVLENSEVARAHAAGVMMSLSADLLVLDDYTRSGSIDLVNLGDDPLKFGLKVDDAAPGIAPDGFPMVRWAPSETVVPPHRSVALRVVFRPPENLPSGEYLFRVFVTARVQRPPEFRRDIGEVKGDSGEVAAALVAPAVPVTVYLRHRIDFLGE